MQLARFINILELKYPKLFAASWDNVGLLVRPPNVNVRNILLTNDFTKAVLSEAKSKQCNLIICYHPVIFKGVKMFDIESKSKEALCLDAFLNNIAIYCPHTILDTVEDGVNDWLISHFGTIENAVIKPVKPFAQFSQYFQSVVSVDVTQSLDKLCSSGKENFYVFSIDNRSYIYSNLLPCDERWYDYFEAVQDETLSKQFTQNCWGDGRIIEMKNSLSISNCIRIIKKQLKLGCIMLASPPQSNPMDVNIKVIGVCAGSGLSVLRGVNADLIITGEMDHHSVLEFVERGIHVILTNHSNSERGFLKNYMHQINLHLGCFNITPDLLPQIMVSTEDCDPLKIV